MDGAIMTTLTPPDPRKVMRQNLPFLRAYAKRVVVEGDNSLTPLDDVKDALVQEERQELQPGRPSRGNAHVQGRIARMLLIG